MSYHRKPHRPRLALAILIANIASLHAVEPPNVEEETLTLSPFEVRSQRDYGYQAANSITATRVGTSIIDTPININVLTGDMIRDTGALDMSQLVNRISSVNTTNREDDKNDKNDVTIRGFPIIVLQNGYEKFFSYPTDFVDRVEVIKGPNSIFFGRVSPGGAVNFITKKPQFKSASELSATYGSYDFRKATLDTTGPIGGKVAYRIFAGYTETNNWIDYTDKDETTTALAVTWQPSTSVIVDANYAYNKAHSGYLHSAPRGHPLYNQPSVDPSIPLNTYIPGLLGSTVPYATSYVYELTYGAKGKEGNYSGPDNYSDREANNADANLTWIVNDLATIRVAANYGDYWGGRLILGGFPAADGSVRQAGTREQMSGEASELSAEALLSFKVAAVENKLLLGYSHRELESRTYTTARATIPTFFPRSDAPIRLGAFVPQLAGTYGLIDDETNAFYFSNQASAIGGRLRLLLGARHTEVESFTGNQAGPDRTTRQKTSANTFQGGAVWQIAPGLNVYGNYSESFQPQPNLDVNGVRAEPTMGTGYEVGVKSDWLDGKVSGTVALYRVERDKIARRDFSRESIEQRSPYFITGGLERSEGVEVDVSAALTRNYQIVLSYGYMWQAETVKDPQTPAQVGRRIFNTPEHVVSVWNKYTILTGKLKGLSLGGGVRYSTEHYAHPLYQIGIVNDDYLLVDAVASYESSLLDHKVTYQLTVRNLLDNDDYYPGSYIPGDPLKAYLSVRFNF
jgi:iron complex outermembrane receptor protein